MVNKEMLALGTTRSVIRELAEYGWAREKVIGRENVFDFSIGNPSVPAPDAVRDTLIDIINNTDPVTLHGYTSAPGDAECRGALAAEIKQNFGLDCSANDLYLTCGAAASLTILLKAMCCEGDEFIIPTPYFPEYLVFVKNAGGKNVVVPSHDDTFQLDIDRLSGAINPHTKAIIINSPNNPSGVIYTKDSIKELSALLNSKSQEYGHPIYIIADEPYRALSYDMETPFIPNFYDNTVVCYSYSKALSLPGERIGYILVPPKANGENLYAAVAGAGRSLGFVCAPSLFQRLVARLVGVTSDVSLYKTNRDLIYNGLLELGYDCVKPDGAFYLFPRSLEEDDVAFCERAKAHELLIVPGSGFGCKGYFRLSYCVPTEKLQRSLAAFEALKKEYDK